MTASTSGVLKSLSPAVTPVKFNNGETADALVDTGSCRSFIRSSVAKRLKLQVTPSSGRISMASSKQSVEITKCCVADITVNEKSYSNICLHLMDNLCAPVLLGHDFLRQHRAITVSFGGGEPPLELCGLLAADIEAPAIFSNISSGSRPIQIKSRRYSKTDSQFISHEVNNLLKQGIITPSRSPWRAQVVVVDQMNKKRMVIDYSQTINKYTDLIAYPVPGITEMVEKVSSYSWFSSIDLKSAYHQIPLKVSERPYTAFEAAGKLYEFTRLPFGVTNGATCFQQVLDELIAAENLKDTFAYIDDITICGHSRYEHDQNLERFRRVAEKYGLTVNENKSVYAQSKISILGHVVENHQVKPDPERMTPLLEMCPPSDKPSLRRTLGLLSHYAKWVPNFSEKIRPLVETRTFFFIGHRFKIIRAAKRRDIYSYSDSNRRESYFHCRNGRLRPLYCSISNTRRKTCCVFLTFTHRVRKAPVSR